MGYEAVVKDAEVEPLNWGVEGRGGLKSWKDKKYIPTDDYDPYGVGPFTRSISRTVEYAYNDFTIALIARALGNIADFEKYLERSTYWKNMYKADQVRLLSKMLAPSKLTRGRRPSSTKPTRASWASCNRAI